MKLFFPVILTYFLCACGTTPPCEFVINRGHRTNWLEWPQTERLPQAVLNDLQLLRESLNATIPEAEAYSFGTSSDGRSLWVAEFTFRLGDAARPRAGAWVWPDWQVADDFVHLPWQSVEEAGGQYLKTVLAGKCVLFDLKTRSEFAVSRELFSTIQCSSRKTCAAIDSEGFVIVGNVEGEAPVQWVRTEAQIAGGTLVWTRAGDLLLAWTGEDDWDTRRLLVLDATGTHLAVKQLPVLGVTATWGNRVLYHLAYKGEYHAEVTAEGELDHIGHFTNWTTRVRSISPSGRFATTFADSFLAPNAKYRVKRLPGVPLSESIPPTTRHAISWLSWCQEEEDGPQSPTRTEQDRVGGGDRPE